MLPRQPFCFRDDFGYFFWHIWCSATADRLNHLNSTPRLKFLRLTRKNLFPVGRIVGFCCYGLLLVRIHICLVDLTEPTITEEHLNVIIGQKGDPLFLSSPFQEGHRRRTVLLPSCVSITYTVPVDP